MTERPTAPGQPPDDDEGSHASVGKEAERPGGGRTESETAVDEAMGTEDDAP